MLQVVERKKEKDEAMSKLYSVDDTHLQIREREREKGITCCNQLLLNSILMLLYTRHNYISLKKDETVLIK